MINIENPATGTTPSAFGMPISGYLPVVTTACTTGAPTSVVRDRKAVIGADLGLVRGSFTGTSAWRPPTC